MKNTSRPVTRHLFGRAPGGNPHCETSLLLRVVHTSPDREPKKRKAEQITVDKWHQATEFGSWKNSFDTEVSHSSQYPRTAVLWIGEVEGAESIDDLITSAPFTGEPIMDFENHDFKIAGGLRKILTGNFEKQVTTAEGKAQSRKLLTDGQTNAWMIYDVFKISGNDEAILDSREVKRPRTTTFRSSTQSWTKKYQQSLTDLLTTY